jgi:hypothetical protein
MNGPVTWDNLWVAIGAVGTIVATCLGLWWKLETRIKSVEKEAADDAEANARELAAHKIHVAETYISKAGHRETTDQILRAIEGLGGRIDSLFTGRRSRGSQE